ncbi:hypothetical protein [Acidovorax sp. BL-A-41-H1]|uniref:hypothetical protein n=1 Tax=Acidovorax sp. BL-A-41-H1 TaxID=3421102 RepID=UPI003F79CEDD
MSTLSKLALLTLVEPDPALAPAPVPDRVYRVTTQVPLYREYRIPVAEAGPGDRIVEERAYIGSADRGVVNGQIVRRYAIRRVLIGYESVTTTVVQPSAPIVSQQPAVKPVAPAWDATAWSIQSLRAPLEATWEVGAFTAGGQGGGALVGLTFIEPTPGQEQQSIIHGIRVEGGIAYTHTSPPDGVQPSGGTGQVFVPFVDVQDGQTLRITVTGGMVRMYANNVLLAEQPSYLGTEPVRLAAVLYDARDTVLNPTLQNITEGQGGATLRLAARGASYPYADGGVQLRIGATGIARNNGVRLRIYSRGSAWQQEGRARFRVQAEGYANYVGTGSGHLTIGPVLARGASYKYATGGFAIVIFATGEGGSPQTNLFGRSVSGGQFLDSLATYPHRGFYARAAASGAFSATVRRNELVRNVMDARGDFKASWVYALQMLEKAGVTGGMGAERVLDVALVSTYGVDAQLTGVLVISATLPGAASVSGDLSGANFISAELPGSLSVDGGMLPQQVLHEALRALSRAGAVVHIPGSNLAVWSVNQATGGSTAYEQYPFNSFARIAGRYYGAAEGGVFELDGDTDNDEPIGALVNLGKRNFGSGNLKGISNAYLTVSSAGQMQVRVTTPEGQSYTYQARRADEFMTVQRADFGRGLRAQYLGLELMNENGADFSLEAAEFVVNELKRRI